MAIDYGVLSQFAKLVNKDNKKSVETTVYGTIVEDSFGNKYVKLDGSDQLTPLNEEERPVADATTALANTGERVSVLIKDHTATITGNVSSPAARDGDVQEIKKNDILLAQRVQANEGYIKNLQADHVSVSELQAANAEISNLKTNKAEVEDLKAANAEIEKLKTTKIDADIVDAKYATIDQLKLNKGEVFDLKAVNLEVTNKLTAAEGDINELHATLFDAESGDIKFANIDFSNIGEAAIRKFFSESGMIKDLVVGDHTVTGQFVGVTVDAGSITTGELVADRIVVKGSDGIYYKLNIEAGAVASTEVTEEQLQNGLHGDTIIAKTITAEKVNVKDLVAFGATIGGFHITNNSLYSGVKSDVNNTTRGIYLDNNGQVAFGDSANFLKLYKDTDNKYKLEIAAQQLKFGANAKSVEDAIDTVQTNVNNIKIGGRNLLTNTHFPENNNRYEHVDKIGEGGFRFIHSDYPQNSYIGDLTTIIPSGTECILSAKIRGNANLVVFSISEAGNRSVKFATPDDMSETEFTEFTVPFTAHADTYAIYLYTSYRYQAYTEWFEIEPRSLKLEFGNKATSWTPAPEDVDASVSNAQSTADSAQAAANANAEDLTNYISVTDAALENLQGQIDGSIMTWFYEVEPTISNAPAKDWTSTDLKNNHLGDLYYDTITGYCYRWQVVNNVYSWQRISDVDVTKALADAKNAQDTADGKRRVFTETPTTPYDVGDLWVQGASGDIMRCQTAKTKSQSYSSADWVKASKYTDDTAAANAQLAANNAQSAANNAQQDIDNLEIGGRNLLTNSKKIVGESATKEFVQFADLAPIFDTHGLIEYTISFDIKSTDTTKKNIVQVYCQNGIGARHSFNEYVTVTTEWQRLHITVTPVLNSPEFTESQLAFYGTYDTGNIPIVRNVKVEKGNRATDWTPAPEDVDASINEVKAITIVGVDVEYVLSDSPTIVPSAEANWSTIAPQWVDGKYMWQRTVTTYGDDTVNITAATCITGATGQNGFNGKGIISVVEQYYKSTSTSTLTGGSWSATYPGWESGKYIWTRSIITYTEGDPTTTDPICVSGTKGDTGVGISAIDVYYYLSTSSTSLAGGSWSTTAPTWVDGRYIWSKTISTLTDGSTKESAAACITGQKGATGATGTGITSVTEEYYLSTSKTTQTGGSWSTTTPTWSTGKYIWTRSKITYKNPTSIVYTTPVCDSSWEAVNEIEIGGRNLLLASKGPYTSDGETYSYGYWNVGRDTWKHGVRLEANTPYYISFDYSIDWDENVEIQDITSTLTQTTKALLKTGGSAEGSGYSTEPFDVQEGEKYFITGAYGYYFILIAEYDSSGAFIGYDGQNDNQTIYAKDYEYVVPEGVAKIAVSTRESISTPSTIVVKKEVATPSEGEQVGFGVGLSETPGNYTFDIQHNASYLTNGDVKETTEAGWPKTGRVKYCFDATDEELSARPYFALRTIRGGQTPTCLNNALVTISNMKLEKGNRATDWTPSPEDTSEAINDVNETANAAHASASANNDRLNSAELRMDSLEGRIVTVVTDGNGTSSLVNTGSGWSFNISSVNADVAKLQTDINDANGTIGKVQDDVDRIKKLTSRIELTEIIEDGNEKPAIILSEDDTAFKMVLTNSDVRFMVGNDTPTSIDTNGISVNNITMPNKSSLRQGSFIWIERSNGNLGLSWKG